VDALVHKPLPNPVSTRIRARLAALLRRVRNVSRLFLWSVIVPTTFATIYFGLFAHDVYISESQFLVRGVQKSVATGIGSLLQSTGLSQDNDVYSVQNFILSRDALAALEREFQLAQIYGSHRVDLINRFNSLGFGGSFEYLLRYYQRFIVESYLDSTSSILTLRVRAFDADHAYRINAQLLDLSETFVNNMNERARDDLVRFALTDVNKAEDQEKSAVVALAKYRNDRALYDPNQQSGLKLAAIQALQQELAGTEKLLSDVHLVAKDNPQLPVLQNRVRVLKAQIMAEMGTVAGDRTSLSSKSPDYESIVLDRDFAAKYLESALESLQQARQNAMNQQLYLERIEEPSTPDVALEPRRALDIIGTFVLSLMLFGILKLLGSAVREHAD
jgi:capsular polysaccharide transport system permease protein